MVLGPEKGPNLDSIQWQCDPHTGALSKPGVDLNGATGVVYGNGHEQQAEAVTATAGGGVDDETLAVVHDRHLDSVVDGIEADGQFAGVGVVQSVAESLLGYVVQQRGGCGRDLDAVVGCAPVDGYAGASKRRSKPVDASCDTQCVEIHGVLVLDDALDGDHLG